MLQGRPVSEERESARPCGEADNDPGSRSERPHRLGSAGDGPDRDQTGGSWATLWKNSQGSTTLLGPR